MWIFLFQTPIPLNSSRPSGNPLGQNRDGTDLNLDERVDATIDPEQIKCPEFDWVSDVCAAWPFVPTRSIILI